MVQFSFRRRTWILGVSYGIAGLVVLVGLVFAAEGRAEDARLQLSNSYRRAFSELTTAAGELDTALQKALYATTPAMLGNLYLQIYAKAAEAQHALGELPVAAELSQTGTFFAQTGDFAHALARTGALCTDEERDTLRALSAAATDLARTLRALESDLAAGSATLDNVLRAEGALAASGAIGTRQVGTSAFQAAEADFPEVPTLIYDGPFSEHLTGREALALKGLPDVSRDEARAAAAAFLHLKPEIFTFVSLSEGDLPAYAFSAAVDGGEVYIEVSRQGGQIVEYFNSRPIGTPTLSNEEALRLAHNYLAAWGYPSMMESYYINSANVLTINFATLQGEVYCYPDLVHLSIALDNGRLVGYNARGYLGNHTERVFEPVQVTREAAEAMVSPDLTMLSHRLTLIPSAGEYEVLCHEFRGQTAAGTHVMVYIGAVSGREEQILLLIEDETGTLTI